MPKPGVAKDDGGADGDSIKVFVRVRPPFDDDGDFGSCLTADTDQNAIIMKAKPEAKVYRFDQVSDIDTTQEAMFSSAGKKLIESCMSGYNGTIFAYGQTGSGKTFTMVGSSGDSNDIQHELRGLIPRSFEYLFHLINRQKELAGERLQFLCRCTFLEIYNEQVFDLLDPGSRGLHLRENINRGVFVDGLMEQAVNSASEAYEVLELGWTNRRVASTSMNRESSRSHAVFTLQIESKENKDGVWQVRASHLNLVDLAGSERQKDTKTAGLRLKEGCNINRSLSALGNVIMALVDISNDKARHVPYRDSKLTFLLRDSLGGNAKTHIIACVHPGHKCFGETLSTLQFARRAKMIKNKAVVNEDMQGDVKALRAHVQRLEKELALMRQGGVPAGLTTEVSPNVAVRTDENTSCGNEGSTEWKENFLEAMFFYKRAVTQTKMADDKCGHLEGLIKRKETALKQTKLILRFRDEGLKKLEKARKSNTEEEQANDIVLSLRAEIKALEERNAEKHEVNQLNIEKRQLQEEINWLRHQLSGHEARESELKQLFDTISSEEAEPENKANHFTPQTTSESTASVGTIERQKSQILKIQDELKTVKRERTVEMERLQSTINELEADLAGARAGKEEIEKSLKMTQQRAAIERQNQDRIHMDTIKTITTPKKAMYHLRNRVVTAESGGNLVGVSPSLNASIAEEGSRLSDEQIPQELHDEHIQGLTEEMEGLRRDNTDLRKQLEETDRKLVELVEEKSRHETQCLKLEQRMASEQQRIADWEKEKDGTMKEQSRLLEEKQLLQSEVQDLRVMSKQSEKEKLEMKQNRDTCKLERDNLESQMFSVSQQLEMLQKELSSLAVDLTNAKTELETSQSELAFTEDAVHQLEERLQEERKQHQSTRDELQLTQMYLEQEFSRNEQLCSQMTQQGTAKEQELLLQMEKTKELEKQIEVMETKLKEAFTTTKAVEVELTKSQANLTQREKEKRETEEMMSGMAGERNQLREEKKRVESELESTRMQLEELIQQQKNQNVELDQYKRRKEEELAGIKNENGEVVVQLDKLRVSFEMQQEDLEAMSTANQELEEQNQKLERRNFQHEQQNEDMKTKLLSFMEDNSRLLVEVSTSDSKVAAQEDLECKVVELSQDLRDSRGDIAILTTQLRDMETKNSVQMEEKLQLQKKVAEEAQTVEVWKEMALNQQAVLQGLETKRNNMEYTIKSQEVEISMISRDLEEARRNSSHTKSLEEMLNQVNESKNQLIDTVKDRDNQITALNEQVSRLMIVAEKDQEEKSDLRSTAEDQIEKVHRLEKEMKEWKDRFNQSQTQAAKLAGHQNPNQKIHHLQMLKEENGKLCEEVVKKDKKILHLEKLLRQYTTNENYSTPQKPNVKDNSTTPIRCSAVVMTTTPGKAVAATTLEKPCLTVTTPGRAGMVTMPVRAGMVTTPVRAGMTSSTSPGHAMLTPNQKKAVPHDGQVASKASKENRKPELL